MEKIFAELEEMVQNIGLESTELHLPDDENENYLLEAQGNDDRIEYIHNPEEPYPIIYAVYPYNIAVSVGGELSEEERNQYLERFELDEWGLDDDYPEKEDFIAGNEVYASGLQALSMIDEKDRREFRYRLEREISNSDTQFKLHEANGAVYQFLIAGRIYVDGGINYRSVFDTTHKISEVEEMGERYIDYTFRLDSQDETGFDDLLDDGLSLQE